MMAAFSVGPLVGMVARALGRAVVTEVGRVGAKLKTQNSKLKTLA
jgi:hypothetical protein